MLSKDRVEKYKILEDEIKIYKGVKVKRIMRLKDNVKGGWIQEEYNLSQKGECFIWDEVVLLGSTRVEGGVQIRGKSVIEDSKIIGRVEVKGSSYIKGSEVSDRVLIEGEVVIEGGVISGRARIRDNARIEGARVRGVAELEGEVQLKGEGVLIEERAVLGGNVRVEGVEGGRIYIGGDVELLEDEEVLADIYPLELNWVK